jgi:hypothetical protein
MDIDLSLQTKNIMTKIYSMIVAATLVSSIVACNAPANEEAKQNVANLDQYVDSVDKLTPVYTVANWTAIDNGYQERALKAEKDLATLKEEDKAKAAASKAKYAAIKTTYETKLKEKEAEEKLAAATPDYRQVLRNRLFGEGKIGSDMKFGFVTANNIHDVYKNFVNTVDDNKNNYTREDWDEIKVLYEALDTRKNAVEKDLATSDNLKIAALKVKFAAIKATHRGGAKAEENEAAKKQ